MKLLQRFGRGRILGSAWSTDSRMMSIVTASGMWHYHVKDVTDYFQSFKFEQAAGISFINFSPNRQLVAISAGNSVQVWDIKTAQLYSNIVYDDNGYQSVIAFDPGGEVLAIYDNSGTVHCWDVRQKTDNSTFNAGRGAFNKVLFSPDGKMLFTLSATALISWEIATGKRQILVKDDNSISLSLLDVREVVISPDGRWLATTGYIGKNVRLWDLSSNEQWTLAEFQHDHAHNLIFASDSKTLIYGTHFAAHILDLASRTELITIHQDGAHFGGDLSLSPDGTLLASLSSLDGALSIWEIANGELYTLSLEPGSEILGFSPDGQQFAYIDRTKSLRIWELSTNKYRTFTHGHFWGVDGIRFNSDMTKLSSASSRDRSTRFWDISSGQQIAATHVGEGDSFILLSPNGTLFASTQGYGSESDTISLCDVETGKEIFSDTHCRPLAFSPDGELFAYIDIDPFGMRNMPISLFNLTNHVSHVLARVGHLSHIFIFSSDFLILAVGHENGTIDLIEVSTGALLKRLNGHTSEIKALAFAGDPVCHNG